MDQEITRKRNINPSTENDDHYPIRRLLFNSAPTPDNDNEALLGLSLSAFNHHQAFNLSPPPLQPPNPPPQPPLSLLTVTAHPPLDINQPPPSSTARAPRRRRNPSQFPREGKSLTIPPPFPWATNQRATVHSLTYLLSNQIHLISGDVVCKRCERGYKMEFDLREKFYEIGSYVRENKVLLCDRAPPGWMNPTLPQCQFCLQENSAKPVIANKKKEINWLFLLLGQMVGCCTLDQLKYFCKHTKNHRTGAKDRVLFLTYLSLCKQLDPDGPFER